MSDLCTKCGKCCYFPTGKNGILQACPHLEKRNNEYHCQIYNDRLGRKIGSLNNRNFYCNYYNSLSSEILDCPLNQNKGKPKRDVLIYTEDWKHAQGVLYG
tara:strand:- start:204 stop:506 length:303 start_codon:yes stop_codon:yes gene_type:complete